jgi:1-hydroxycarotenoid 3,4-desaturase
MMNDLGPTGLLTLGGLGPFASLWRSLGRHFHDPRLQQLFGRYATYCGSSPWSAPATLMLVAQVELDGVWSVSGGMIQVAKALANLGHKHGVLSRYGVACSKI